MEYSIGDFAEISRMGIKTLRYYHEIGLLIPTRIDKFNSYRYYDEKSLGKVETINRLKELNFPLESIKEILENHQDDQNLVQYMKDRLVVVDPTFSGNTAIREKIEAFIRTESSISEPVSDVTIKKVPDVFIASVCFKGRYTEINQQFNRLFEIFDMVANGPPFTLYHDEHHADEDMNIECCIPITRKQPAAGINYYVLPGAKMVTSLHKGDYSNIWMAYQKTVDYLNKKKLPIQTPYRETYLQGKGRNLPDEPAEYLTEIQFPVNDNEDPFSRRDRELAGVRFYF